MGYVRIVSLLRKTRVFFLKEAFRFGFKYVDLKKRKIMFCRRAKKKEGGKKRQEEGRKKKREKREREIEREKKGRTNARPRPD